MSNQFRTLTGGGTAWESGKVYSGEDKSEFDTAQWNRYRESLHNTARQVLSGQVSRVPLEALPTPSESAPLGKAPATIYQEVLASNGGAWPIICSIIAFTGIAIARVAGETTAFQLGISWQNGINARTSSSELLERVNRLGEVSIGIKGHSASREDYESVAAASDEKGNIITKRYLYSPVGQTIYDPYDAVAKLIQYVHAQNPNGQFKIATLVEPIGQFVREKNSQQLKTQIHKIGREEPGAKWTINQNVKTVSRLPFIAELSYDDLSKRVYGAKTVWANLQEHMPAAFVAAQESGLLTKSEQLRTDVKPEVGQPIEWTDQNGDQQVLQPIQEPTEPNLDNMDVTYNAVKAEIPNLDSIADQPVPTVLQNTPEDTAAVLRRRATQNGLPAVADLLTRPNSDGYKLLIAKAAISNAGLRALNRITFPDGTNISNNPISQGLKASNLGWFYSLDFDQVSEQAIQDRAIAGQGKSGDATLMMGIEIELGNSNDDLYGDQLPFYWMAQGFASHPTATWFIARPGTNFPTVSALEGGLGITKMTLPGLQRPNLLFHYAAGIDHKVRGFCGLNPFTVKRMQRGLQDYPRRILYTDLGIALAAPTTANLAPLRTDVMATTFVIESSDDQGITVKSPNDIHQALINAGLACNVITDIQGIANLIRTLDTFFMRQLILGLNAPNAQNRILQWNTEPPTQART